MSMRDRLWNSRRGAACTLPTGLLFFGIAAVLIITSYLHEPKHHPAGKTASHEVSVTTRK